MIGTKPLSCVGTPIMATESARLNASSRFFRVSSNLSLARKSTLLKFTRYIRFGLLAPQDAQDLILGRLPLRKLRKYQLVKYWISSGFDREHSFYYSPTQLWHEKENPVESITLFP